MKKVYQLLVFILSISLLACNNDATELEKVNQLSKTIPTIYTTSLHKMITEKNMDFMLIDVRNEEKFENGHIEEAINLPIDTIEYLISDTAYWENQFMYPPEDSSLIIIYSGNGQQGFLAAEKLIKKGFKKVKNLDGGYETYQIAKNRQLIK